MEMTLRDCLREASALSLKHDAEALGCSEPMPGASVDLPQDRIEELSRKMLLLPHEAVVLLLNRYSFRLSPADTEELYDIEDAKGRFRFYRRLLSDCMGLGEDELISDASMESACKSMMEEYLRIEMGETVTEDKIVPFQGKRRIRTVGRALLIAAILAALLIGMLMAVSAEFRERVLSWFIEEHREYSVFQIKHSVDYTSATAQSFLFTYLPEGTVLVDSYDNGYYVEREYEVNKTQYIDIMIFPDGQKNYVDTENADLHDFRTEYLEGYWFAKDTLHYACFELDGYHFSLSGTVDIDELLKVAQSVTRVDRAYGDPRGFYFTYLPEGAEEVDGFTEADFVYHEYEFGDGKTVKIMTCPDRCKVSVNTEHAELHEFRMGELEGWWFAKEGLNYVCFGLDGCYISVYGTADIDELFKVAASVRRANLMLANPLAYELTYLPEGTELINDGSGSFYAFCVYEVKGTQGFDVLIVPADQREYLDTEDVELHPLQLGEAEGYWFTREDTNFVCFAKEGCQFSLSGSLDIDEMLKIAAGIRQREGIRVQPTRPNTDNENAAPVVEYDKSLMEMEDALQARVENLDWVRNALVTLSSADSGQIIEVDINVDTDVLDETRQNELISLAMEEVPGLERNLIYIRDWEGRNID